MTNGRSMCNQHVRVLGNRPPLGLDLISSLQIESPIMKPWLPRRSIDLNALYRHGSVLEIRAALKQGFGLAGVLNGTEEPAFLGIKSSIQIKWKIMVSSDDNLVSKGLAFEEAVEVRNLACLAHAREITGVKKDISIGKNKVIRVVVRV